MLRDETPCYRCGRPWATIAGAAYCQALDIEREQGGVAWTWRWIERAQAIALAAIIVWGLVGGWR